MATNWKKYPSQTPAAARQWREQRRHTIEAAATRAWSRLWRKAGGKKRGRIATGAEIVSLWHQQGGRCALTGLVLEPHYAHLDHRIARVRGGAHTIDNLQWVHPMANYAKNTSTIEEFRVWLLAAADSLRQKMELESVL
jgi:5-methylcytosine-specific restriction endonuclease McrA